MNTKLLAPLALVLALASGCSGEPTPGSSIRVTASAEELGLTGYAFPPGPGQEVAMVDGWEVRFERVLTTVGNVTLSDGPDTSSGDKSLTGPVVARLDGPWAVDLHAMKNGDPGVVAGKGGGGDLALELGVLDAKLDGSAFDPTERYAFGYELLPASAAAAPLNLDAEGQALYDQMVAQGLTTLFVGEATFKGQGCTSSDAGEPAPYDFDGLPDVVRFELAFSWDARLSSQNCENPDNDPAEPLPGEESLRGVQVKENAETIAQVTLHTDHVFWTSLVHDSPPYFDHLAAWAKDVNGVPTVTLADLAGVDLAELVDQNGTPIPWRSCLADVPVMTTPLYRNFAVPGGSGEADVADFLQTAASTMGHLNADGLCHVVVGP